MPAKWKSLDAAFRSGKPAAIIAELKRVPWQQAPLLHHPLWDLLGKSEHMRPEDSVAVFDALLEMGMDPKTLPTQAAASLGPYAFARPIDRSRLSEPAGHIELYGAGLWTRALAFRGRRPLRLAWLQRLKSLDLPPEPQDWREAVVQGHLDLLVHWHAQGHAVPQAESLIHNRMHADLDVAATVSVLKQIGWCPSAGMVENVLKAQGVGWLSVLLTGWRDVWNGTPAQHARALLVLWRNAPSAALTESLMEDPVWREAAQLPVGPLPELSTTPLSDTPLPPWVVLLHPSRRSVEMKDTRDAWEVVQRQLGLGEGHVEGWTAPELWAWVGRRPHEAAGWTLDRGPNPTTGRWPAAAAVRGAQEWVELGGGMDAALDDPQGPLAEWMERAGRTETPFEALAVEGIREAPLDALAATWKNVPLELWAMGTPLLRQAWRARLGQVPRPRQNPAAAAWVAAMGNPLAPLEKRVYGLSPEGCAQLVALACARPSWVDEMRDKQHPEDTRCFDRVLVLHETGAPLPTSAEAWAGWTHLLHGKFSHDLLAGVPQPGAPNPVWEWWGRLRNWPPCLAHDWAATLLMQARRLMSDTGAPDVMRPGGPDFLTGLMRTGLARAADPRAAWECLCWEILAPNGVVVDRPVAGEVLFQGLLAVADPGWAEEFPFDQVRDRWEAARDLMDGTDEPVSSSMPEWLAVQCMAAQLKRAVPAEETEERRTRLRM